MALFNRRDGWGWPARLIHWSSGAVILFLLVVGTYMNNFVDDVYEQFALFQTHKSWGVVAFMLGVLRLVWRAINSTPELPNTMNGIERLGAKASHLLLYLLVILMPLSGWLMASASPLQDSYGIKNMVFGIFELPDPFVPGSMELEAIFSTIHTAAAITLSVMILLHAAAAIRHQFVKRDGLIRRMIVGTASR
ncbi:MAG: cytochrome b [Pseudomonadota bacterium]